MKKTIALTTLGLFLLQATYSQSGPKVTKVYAQLGAGPIVNNGAAAELGARVVLADHWTVGASWLSQTAEANVPANYIANYQNAGCFIFCWSGGPIPPPQVKTGFLHVSGGRFFPLSRSFFFTAEGGIGLASGEQLKFYPKGSIGSKGFEYETLSTNYDMTMEKKQSIGGIAKMRLDWAFSGAVGLGLQVYYNVNAGGLKDYFGTQFYLSVGWMHKGPKVKKQNY